MLIKLDLKFSHLFIYTFSLSLASIFFALYYQYIKNYPPCELCIFQRIPYFCISLFSVFGLITQKYKENTLMLILLIFVSSFLLSFFHVGVEQDLWKYGSSCSNNVGDFENIEDLREFLSKVPITKCDEVLVSFWGFSMASLNMIFSFLNVVILIIFYKKFKNE
tara:strand:+ start:236 stop:727 length:492 start_codon:yes stop_codon:yes gene_type:complete